MEIHVGKGIGPVSLGMTLDEVRAALPGERLIAREAQRNYLDTGIDVAARDVFADLGLRVEYRDGVCVAVELAAPSAATCEGVALLETPMDRLLAWLRRRDPALEVDASGCTSRVLGLGLYAPRLDEAPQAPPEGVIVFGPGYYD